MPTCSASFFKKDSRQAGMTTLKNYVNLLNAFVLIVLPCEVTGDIRSQIIKEVFNINLSVIRLA